MSTISQGQKSPINHKESKKVKQHEMYLWLSLQETFDPLENEYFPEFRMKDNLFTI